MGLGKMALNGNGRDCGKWALNGNYFGGCCKLDGCGVTYI